MSLVRHQKKYAPSIPYGDSGQVVESILSKLSYFQTRKYLHTSPNAFPQFLYRYISPDISEAKLREQLIDSDFWLSSSSDFNDPFDMTAHVVLEGGVMEKRAKLDALVKQHNKSLGWRERQTEVTRMMTNPTFEKSGIKRILEKNLREAGVLCFSESPKNVLMWSHYAKDHKGLVLQFEIAKHAEEFTGALPVAYNGAYPTFNWFKKTEDQLMNIILRKHPDWGYEKERRIVRIGDAHTFLYINPEALTGIIFGCKAEEKLKEKVKRVLRSRAQKRISLVKLYQAYKSPSEYKLIIGKLSN